MKLPRTILVNYQKIDLIESLLEFLKSERSDLPIFIELSILRVPTDLENLERSGNKMWSGNCMVLLKVREKFSKNTNCHEICMLISLIVLQYSPI